MKRLFIIVLVSLLSCTSQNREQAKLVYDKAALKAFILHTHLITEREALTQLDSILNKAAGDSMIFHQTISFLQTPFSDPNSSYRNQNLYSKLLQAEISSKWYNGYEKKIAADRIKLLQQNNVGDSANDFTYTTPAGFRKRMYALQANFLLLYFNNPECDACKQMKEALTASTIINQKLKAGELKILSIYTDKDEKLWLNHLSEYPDKWIQGRDEDEYLYQNRVYDLRAIPTIYLLDKNKTVLLKDCTEVIEIEKMLSGDQN